MWLIFALLSAVFAALTSILAKVGIEGVNSNLATAIRTLVVLVMAWGMVFLTDAQKTKREEEITTKEKEVAELRYKYFGPEGELFKKRQSLLKPIQDDVYNAIKKVSEERGYMVIFDRASSESIVFASPKIDISNEVLTKLGYSK